MKSVLFCVASGVLSTSALAQSDTSPPTTVDGVIFAHWGMDLSDGENYANDFNIDRAYLTARRKLGDSLAIRVTTDVAREKDQPEDEKIRVYLKYAYLEWKNALPGVKFRFGAAGTPLINYRDSFVRHRYIRKSFTECFRCASSAHYLE